MKKIKTFEKFNDSVRKFFTGHDNNDAKQGAKDKILSDIQEKVAKLVELGHLSEEKVNVRIETLTKRAEDNNWKGKIVIRTSPRGKVFLVYDDGNSPLQDLGSSASGSVKGNL